VYYVIGRLAIGQNETGTSTITEFTANGRTVVWRNGLVITGFHALLLDIATSGTVITLTNCSLVSNGEINNTANRGYTTTEDSRPVLQVTGTSGSVSMTSCVIDNFASIAVTAQTTYTDCVITDTGLITASAAGSMAGSSILTSTVAADEGALFWNNATSPETYTNGMTFSKGTNAHHAMRFGTGIASNFTLRNIEFTGFGSTPDANDSTVRFDATAGDITLSLVGCTVNGAAASASNFSVDDAAGINVTVQFDTVDTVVHVDDHNGNDLINARVLLEASDNSGDFPYQATPVQITHSSGTVTVEHTGHGMITDDVVVVRGAVQQAYNGPHAITFTDANHYTYQDTIDGGTASPATGTITITGAIFEGLTDSNGDISRSRTVTLDTPVSGRVRKSSGTPRYKSFPISGTIDNATGLTINVRLVLDE